MPGTVGPIAVNTSAHDADQAAGSAVVLTNSPLLNCDTAGVWNAWLFTGVTIPASSKITEAYMTVNFTSTSLDEPDVTIYGLDTATPAAFGTAANNIGSRTRTSGTVNWSNTNAGGADINTSDLSVIVQELVDSYAPYTAGTMGFVWTTRAANGARDTSVTGYDGSTTECNRLYIVYYPPSNGTVDATLGALTISSASQLIIDGDLTSTFGALELVAESTIAAAGAAGSLDATLGALELTSANQLLIDGDLTSTLGALALSSDSDLIIDGDLTSTLETIVLASANQLIIDGDLDSTLGVLSISSEGTGVTITTGSLSATLATITISSNSTLLISGNVTSTLGALTLSSDNKLFIDGDLTSTLGDLVLSSLSTISPVTGQLTSTFDGISISSSGALALVGTFTQSLGVLSINSTGTISDQTGINGSMEVVLTAITIMAVGSIVLQTGNRTVYKHSSGRSVSSNGGHTYKAKVRI